jgi:hypothetical protein
MSCKRDFAQAAQGGAAGGVPTDMAIVPDRIARFQEIMAAGTDVTAMNRAVLEQVVSTAPPEVAWGLRLCALAHWFNAGILALLADAELATATAGAGTPASACPPGDPSPAHGVMEQMAAYPFVQPRVGGGYVYNESERAALLAWWGEDAGRHERRRALSGRLQAHFLALAGETEDAERAFLLRAEALYHQALAEPEASIAALRQLFQEQEGNLACQEHLLRTLEEHGDDLGQEQRQWLRYYRGRMHLSLGNTLQGAMAWWQLINEGMPPELWEEMEEWLVRDTSHIVEVISKGGLYDRKNC